MVDEVDGPKTYTEKEYKTTNEMDSLKSMVDRYLERIDKREPNSNAEMPFIYMQRQALEKEAEEKLKAEQEAKAKEEKAKKKDKKQKKAVEG